MADMSDDPGSLHSGGKWSIINVGRSIADGCYGPEGARVCESLL